MLKTQGKEYIVDTGFHYVLLGRENLSAFMKLKNHHPKTVICLDPEEPTYNGIVQRNAIKWLLETQRESWSND
jgi:hypothetical protein